VFLQLLDGNGNMMTGYHLSSSFARHLTLFNSVSSVQKVGQAIRPLILGPNRSLRLISRPGREGMERVVRGAYNYAVKRTFVVSAVTGGLAFLCTLGLKWRNIKKPLKETVNVADNVEMSG